MGKIVTEYEIFDDHDIQNSQYFQGWSPPDGWDGATGAGDNPHEEMEDALEMIAQGGDWDLATVTNDLPDNPSVAEMPGEVEDCLTCNGTGRVIDEDFEGWGTPTVEGEGEYGVEPETVECPDCDGAGTVDAGDMYDDNDSHYYISVAVRGIDDTLEGSWLTDTVKNVARGVLQHGDAEEAAILADALEEAGCTNGELLEFLRDDQGWIEIERVINWMLGSYSNDATYLKSHGLTFHEFTSQARGFLNWPSAADYIDNKEEFDARQEEMRQLWMNVYDYIKTNWPYGGTPERAVDGYLAQVG